MTVVLAIVLSCFTSFGMAFEDEDTAVEFPAVPMEELTQPKWQNYSAIDLDQFRSLLQKYRERQAKFDHQVLRGTYRAKLTGDRLEAGQVVLELPNDDASAKSQSIVLGRSNLRRLRFQDSTGPLNLATDRQGRLVTLRPSSDQRLTGRWAADSQRRGRALVFPLELPEAAVSVIEIETDSKMQAACSNGIVNRLEENEDRILWQFFPSDPRRITLEFTSIVRAVANRTVKSSVAADFLINEAQTLVNWAVPIQRDAALSMTLELSELCQIRDVKSGDQTLNWSRNGKTMVVDLTQRTTGRFVRIQASLPTQLDSEFSLPFLLPIQWNEAEQSEPLILESCVLRVAVDSLLAIENTRLKDVLQESMTFDGSRRVLEIRQFGAEPQVVFQLQRSMPLVEDQVVVTEGEIGSTADSVVWVNVKAATGVVDRVTWDVPNSWRVTDVRDDSLRSAPLFFRQESQEGFDRFQLQAMLRTPLAAGQDQTLRITMQAIAGQANRVPASLLNPNYLRKADFVAFANAADPRIQQVWSESEVTPAEKDELPWLNASILQGKRLVPRKQVRSFEIESTERDDTFASIYSTMELQNSQLLETLRIRLRNSTELPRRLEVQCPSGLRPVLDEAPAGAEWYRSGEAADSDLWTLELPVLRRPLGQVAECEFVLKSNRSLQGIQQGFIPRIIGVTIRGGLLEVPPLESGIQLQLRTEGGSTELDRTIEYPSGNFRLEIQTNSEDCELKAVHGRSFLMLTGDGDNLQAHELHRCLVQINPTEKEALLVRSLTPDVRFFIEGNEVSVPLRDGVYAVPLPDAASLVRLDAIACCQLSKKFACRLLSFEDAEAVNIATTVQVAAENRFADHQRLLRIDAAEVATTMADSTESGTLLAQLIADFESTWRLHASLNAEAVIVRDEKHKLRVSTVESNFVWTVLIGVAVFVTWHIPRRNLHVAAAGIVIFSVILRWVIFSDWPFWLLGITVGTICFGLNGFFRTRNRRRQGRLTRVSSSTLVASLLLVVSWVSVSSKVAYADDQPVAVRPQTNGASLPILFVENEYLKTIKAAQSTVTNSVTLSVDVDVEWQAPGLLKGKCTTIIGCRPGERGTLTIPTEEVTLTECWCDGVVVFPRRNELGETIIETSVLAELPDLAPTDESALASDGPNCFAGWDLRTIEYSFLLTTEIRNGEVRHTIPFPESPIANLQLKDPRHHLRSVWVGSRRVRSDEGVFYLPEIFQANQVSLKLKVEASTTGNDQQTRQASALISAVVAPERVELAVEYLIRPANLSTETAIVGFIPGHSVAVETLDGDALRWSLLGDEIAISIAPDDNGQQRFRLLQTIESELNRLHSINIEPLLQVNPQQVDRAVLTARAVEPFLLKPVQIDGHVLALDPDGATGDAANFSRRFLLPDDARRLQLELIARDFSVEPTISQRAIVQQDRIDWFCRCEVDVTGAPIFQQQIYISPDVTIERVEATSNETVRLQSWSRTQDALLITLREATQGILDIQLEGFVRRIPGVDTSLPIVTFPAGSAPLASDLELQSGMTPRCFLADLGGAYADEQFDLQAPLSSDPVRLSLINDQQPVVIQAAQPQLIRGALTSYVYSVSGQTRVAHLLTCQLADTDSPFRFRLRNSNTEVASVLVSADGRLMEFSVSNGIVTVPPAEVEQAEVRILIADQIPGIRNNSLSLTLPEFEDSFQLTASRCFDVRSVRNGLTRIPKADQSEFAGLGVLLPELGNLRPLSPTDNGRQLLVRSPVPSTEGQAAESVGGVAYVDEQHVVFVNDHSVSGTTCLLSFSSSARSLLQLSIPETTLLTQIRVNGQTIFCDTTHPRIDVPLEQSVSQVQIDWVLRNRLLSDDDLCSVPLLSTSAAQSDRRIGIVDRTSASMLALDVKTLNNSQVAKLQSASVSSGFQFAELQNEELDRMDTDLDVPLGKKIRTQLAAFSPVAATSYMRHAQDFPKNTTWILSETSVVSFYQRQRWSILDLGCLLLGVCLLMVALLQRKFRAGPLQRSETSTIVKTPMRTSLSDDPTLLVPPEAGSQTMGSSIAK